MEIQTSHNWTSKAVQICNLDRLWVEQSMNPNPRGKTNLLYQAWKEYGCLRFSQKIPLALQCLNKFRKKFKHLYRMKFCPRPIMTITREIKNLFKKPEQPKTSAKGNRQRREIRHL